MSTLKNIKFQQKKTQLVYFFYLKSLPKTYKINEKILFNQNQI